MTFFTTKYIFAQKFACTIGINFVIFRSSQNLLKIISWTLLITGLWIFEKMSATPTRRKNRHRFIHVQMRNNAVQSCTEFPRNKQLFFYITIQYSTVQYNTVGTVQRILVLLFTFVLHLSSKLYILVRIKGTVL